MKRGWIVAAFVSLVLGAAIFGIAFVLSGFDLPYLGGKYKIVSYTVEQPFDKIDILTKGVDIEFKLSADGGCCILSPEQEKVTQEIFVEGDVLKIRTKDERDWVERVVLFSKDATMTVCLPAARYASLTTECGTGDISIPADFSFDNARIKTSTGDVDCRASVREELKIETSTGDVSLNDLHAGKADLSVSTGDVSANGLICDGTLSVAVDTGKTTLTDVTCGELTSTGSTGKVVLKNTIATGNFHLERSTGDVRFESCDAAEITVNVSTGDVTGTLRTEKRFFAHTSTGKVDVPTTSAGGTCTITASTGDIKITVEGK